MMTEGEAKKKTCVFMMVGMSVCSILSTAKIETKIEVIVKGTTCLGSDCVTGWRWAERYSPSPETEIIYSTVHGYCGLGGKP